MHHQLLEKHFSNYMRLAPSELKEICSRYQLKDVKKGEWILRRGEVCSFEGYVVQGCFTVSTINEEGKERILYFAAEDWWIMEIDSFTNQIGSELDIKALEDNKILTISYQAKEQLYEDFPKVERLFRIMSQKAIAAWQRRLIRNHSMSAEERYYHFMESYPDIFSRVTNRQVASYLGITHEFLSKIRSKRRFT